MRLSVASITLLLCACGAQSTFAKEFVDTYCDAYISCDTTGRPCPVSLDDETAYKACDFDAGAAETCVAGPFTCNDTVETFEVIEAPEACREVCGSVE